MRAMVVLIFVWGSLVSTTPGVVDQYFSDSTDAVQPAASAAVSIENASVDQSLLHRASLLRQPCRTDDSGYRSATMQSAVYAPATNIPGQAGAVQCP